MRLENNVLTLWHKTFTIKITFHTKEFGEFSKNYVQVFHCKENITSEILSDFNKVNFTLSKLSNLKTKLDILSKQDKYKPYQDTFMPKTMPWEYYQSIPR